MRQLNTKMNHTFLVLLDFSKASYKALKYTISLAKLLKGEIHVMYVANPMDLVYSDNPAIAIRDIEFDTRKNERKLKAITEIIATEGIEATSCYSIGNVISLFEERVERTKPSLVIVGKKLEKSKFSGKLSSYLMNNYKGSLLVVGEESEFQIDTKISLGCNVNTLNLSNLEILHTLNTYTEIPLTLVEVKNTIDSNPQKNLPEGWKSLYEKDQNIQFECQNDSTVVNGLVNHVSQNKIKLLCIGRGKPKGFLERLFLNQGTTASKVVNKINAPILVLGANV
jgi:nucleotide-binding universal stress UspA family protein